jgi:signal transduction histidine kinase
MRFSDFIRGNLDEIVSEWETFARTLLPAAKSMSDLALRDHSRDILIAIAKDMDTSQTNDERAMKSTRLGLAAGALETAAAAHGAVRQLAGFELTQLVGEFRAMRASVLALWRRRAGGNVGSSAIEEIARFNEGIDQALAESVERYSTDISTFLAVIGHDLRSPLWSIQGSSDLLASPTLSEVSRVAAIARIQRSSKSMARLISDLLEYAGTQLGRGIPVQLAHCDLATFCNDAIDSVRAIFPRREFKLALSGDLHLQADALRVQQVLSNLLSNAVQHGDPDASILLSAFGDSDAIQLNVVNSGLPIASNELHSIFDPLVQIPTSKSAPHEHPYTGLGMGLYIAREIVHRHEGAISVTSSVQVGTAFTVMLPKRSPQRDLVRLRDVAA